MVSLGVCGALLAALAGCGETRHQDAGEPRGVFRVQVTHAAFPAHQAVSRPTEMRLDVRNTGTRTVPNVAVSVTSFYYLSDYPGLSTRRRPVWVVDQGPGPVAKPPVETAQVDPPGGGTTASYNVWALGSLAPGATRSFVWHVSPVKSGVYTVSYRVYAGLHGRARAQLASGAPSAGSFTVDVATRPPATHVNPKTGRVEPGAFAPSEA